MYVGLANLTSLSFYQGKRDLEKLNDSFKVVYVPHEGQNPNSCFEPDAF